MRRRATRLPPRATLVVAAGVAIAALTGCGNDVPDTADDTNAATTTHSMPAASTAAPSAASNMPAGSGQDTTSGSGRRFRPRDDGALASLAIGETATLLLPTTADEPSVDGTSVIVIPLASFTAAGEREYEIRAVTPGTSTVAGREPAYELTFVVTT